MNIKDKMISDVGRFIGKSKAEAVVEGAMEETSSFCGTC